MPIKAQHVVAPGDRISRIAANYKVTTQDIINANPNIFTPERNAETNKLIGNNTFPAGEVLIYAGEVLNIPTGLIDEIGEVQTLKVDSEDELTIIIDGRKCPLPHSFEFTEYFDTCSDNFNITYPYDPTLSNPAYRVNIDTFKTKGLPGIKIFIGEDPVLTGEIEVPSNTITPSATIQTISGRSKTYLLEKSDVLPTIQREFIEQDLKEISEIVAASYGIGLEVGENVELGEVFAKANIGDNEKPYFFIARLSRERSALVSKTGSGSCFIRKAEKSDPVANFKIEIKNNSLGVSTAGKSYGFIGVQSLEFSFDTTKLFGTYIGKGQTTDDQNLTETVKSQVIIQQSVNITSFEDATDLTLQATTEWEEKKAIREFYKNAIPFPSWINPNNNKRWKPGQIITLEAIEAGIEQPKEMLIRFITFTKNSSDRRVAILNIIPQEVYL